MKRRLHRTVINFVCSSELHLFSKFVKYFYIPLTINKKPLNTFKWMITFVLRLNFSKNNHVLKKLAMHEERELIIYYPMQFLSIRPFRPRQEVGQKTSILGKETIMAGISKQQIYYKNMQMARASLSLLANNDCFPNKRMLRAIMVQRKERSVATLPKQQRLPERGKISLIRKFVGSMSWWKDVFPLCRIVMECILMVNATPPHHHCFPYWWIGLS